MTADRDLGSEARQMLAERTADLQAAEAANEALRRANAELRASRAALAASEARLRLALGAARMANWEWDPIADVVTGSEGREALYGRPPGSMRSAPEVLAAVHPEDRERCAATIRRAMERMPGEEEFDAVEFRVLHPDGSIRWLRSQGRITDRDPLTGRALRAAGVTFDITQRREAETRYRVLFDASPFAVIVIDQATFRILDVNTRACRDYGYSREEFLSLLITDIDVLGDEAAIRARGRAHKTGERTQEFEAVHRTRDGALRDVLVRVEGLDLGNGRVTYGAHIDITARKAAEVELRRSEERLRVALEAGGLGAWELDFSRRRTRWDARLAAILGRERVDAEVANEVLSRCLEPADLPAVQEAFRQAMATGGDFAAEFRILRPDGEHRWVRCWGRLLPDQHPGHRRMAGVVADVTEHRQAEERQLLFMREMDHRAKNILAVVQAALRLTPRHDADSYAAMVEGRVSALARAHTLLAENRWTGADLAALLRAELQPFLTAAPEAPEATRILLEGPALTVAPQSTQALGMALHELATNAMKYGALSTAGGHVALGWEVTGEALRLRWEERGGPPLAGPPPASGFGTRVIEATLERQLGGTVRRDWRPEGLVVEAMLPIGTIRAR
ncbi:PAS domain S-box protein [Paracraurococcus lichenis]|uniref:histidine kinase n=1 Tax=Paracraurococcus lichenis TaxID=3064888 RepID=A0ABT9DZ03_9PROT|nr:PAS domain S-box protein [Paracraurococcus sp. LOR1-02]MDO9709116.1 PAS domain S-box protein [Paracraurococcus sp. LOR1-02]